MIVEQMLKNAQTPLLHISDVSGSALIIKTMIKDKNGWIKVESSNDYPDKDCRYWIANENGVFDFFADRWQIARKFENGTLTHYKELDETLPPIELQS